MRTRSPEISFEGLFSRSPDIRFGGMQSRSSVVGFDGLLSQSRKVFFGTPDSDCKAYDYTPVINSAVNSILTAYGDDLAEVLNGKY